MSSLIQNDGTGDVVGTATQKKTVVIALPGREYSGNFLVAWTRAITGLFQLNYQVVVLNRFSSFVSFSRMQTLGLSVLRGAHQEPFDGKLKYDVWVTIDSDVIFTTEQLIELIENTDVHPVVSGLYMMADLQHFPCIAEWDEVYFAKHGTFKFMTPKDIEAYKTTVGQKFMPVVYNGMGFFACRRGVIEKMHYPYFWAELQEIRSPDGILLRDMCSEDVAFCKGLHKAGFTVYVNTDIRVGHEKMLVI